MKLYKPLTSNEESIARQIIDAGYRVHKKLGPGMLESVYETCLCYELEKRRLTYQRQVHIPVVYDQIRLEQAFRLDLLVENVVICELKSTELVTRTHYAQLLSYLRLTGKRLGLLLNFNVPLIKEGIKRIIL